MSDDEPGGKPDPLESWVHYFKSLMATAILDDIGWYIGGSIRNWISSSCSNCNMGHCPYDVPNLVVASRIKNL